MNYCREPGHITYTQPGAARVLPVPVPTQTVLEGRAACMCCVGPGRTSSAARVLVASVRPIATL